MGFGSTASLEIVQILVFFARPKKTFSRRTRAPFCGQISIWWRVFLEGSHVALHQNNHLSIRTRSTCHNRRTCRHALKKNVTFANAFPFQNKVSLERAPKNDGGSAYRYVSVVVCTRASWYGVVFMRPAIVGIGVTVRGKGVTARVTSDG